jgi:SAM-dependent methyltransferase
VALEGIVHADARELLPHPALAHEVGTFDIVLCLGPLYHLLSSKDRTQVLENCLQLAKPGGYIVAAYVSVYAHLRDMARRDPGRLSREWDFYSSYLSTGHYTRNPLTESFHIYPNALKEELAPLEGKVEVERVVSCEGFLGFGGAKTLAGLSDEEMEKWVDVVMRSAEDRETLNSADHLLVVLKKVE